MSDNALVLYAVPELSPEAAEQRAVAIRATLDQRPGDAVIRAWLQYVAVAVARPRPTDDEIVMLTGILLDGEYPAAVFNQATRREAARRFKYWPSAAEIWDLLAPHIEAMGIELPGLDRIVRNAKRPPIVPAREAFGYDPGPASPQRKARAAGRIDAKAEADDLQAIASQRRQLAALAGDVVPPESKPEPARPMIAAINRAPIAKPDPSPLPPVRRRR